MNVYLKALGNINNKKRSVITMKCEFFVGKKQNCGLYEAESEVEEEPSDSCLCFLRLLAASGLTLVRAEVWSQ